VRDFLQFTIIGLTGGAVLAVSASGLVLTYTTSGVFNFAHGAMGMIMAFLFWELRVARGWPTWLALVVVLLIAAPLMGAFVERFLIRNLEGAPLVASLVVTIGLMVSLMALAGIIWPTNARRLPPFFGFKSFTVLDVAVSYHRALTMVLAVVLAFGLRLFLHRARTGVAMRAVVDSRPLTALHGARPGMVSMLSWSIGASLAALAGILLAPDVSLTVVTLTLLVVYGYAAAVFGRLSSLPLTFLGALLIGLAQAYAQGYIKPSTAAHSYDWSNITNAVPVLALFLFLLFIPASRLVGARSFKRAHLKVPSLRSSVITGLVIVAVFFVISGLFHGTDLTRIGEGLAFAIIALSLVPLTGYAGQISLCQMTFAGIGAWAMSKWGDGGSPLGIVMAVLIAAAFGFLVALPTLRLQGLYLALATMAFAALMDPMFFRQRAILFGGGVQVERPDLGPVSFAGNRAFVVLLAVAFAVLSIAILALRRGPFGRRLIALRDSPAASATLGLSVTRTKLTVFTVSAGIAGLGGALYGGLRTTAGPDDFQMFASLPVLLLAVVGGVTTIIGPLIGGMVLALLPWIATARPALANLAALTPGLAGIGLGRNPDGAAADIAERVAELRGQIDDPAKEAEFALDPIGALATPVGARIDAEQVHALDRLLDLDDSLVDAR